ncbi:MAG: hypothetical protein ABIS08_10755 [Pseudolysinimonas sp.]
MRTTTRALGLLAVVVATVASLTACDPGPGSPVADPTVHGPSASHTATATPTPTPDPLAPAFVEVNAHSVGVGARNSRQLIDIPYTTPLATAAAEFSTTIGVEPTVTAVPANACFPASSTYDWGGIEFYFDPYGGTLHAAYSVSVTAAQTRGGLDLGAHGQTVGTSLADVLAHVPGSQSGDRGEGHIEAVVDPQDGANWGVILHIQSGTVHDFTAPGLFIIGHGTC